MKELAAVAAVTFRRATRTDWDQISELNVITKRPRRADSLPQEYFVAETSSGIVGCAALRCRRNAGYLYGLTVHPRWRRLGIGHSLTAQRLETIQAARLTAAYVFAMFWNVRFFKSHGFSLIKRAFGSQLRWLHEDFEEEWCRRSALLTSTVDVPKNHRQSK